MPVVNILYWLVDEDVMSKSLANCALSECAVHKPSTLLCVLCGLYSMSC